MSIVPSGKRKFMVAQMQLPAMEGDDMDTSGVTPEMMQPNRVDQLEKEVDDVALEQEEDTQNSDIRQIVFEFLTELGFPPRRLQEFKSQFANESGDKNVDRKVTVLMPDQVYGENKQIPLEFVKKLVQRIENEHGLSFDNYRRINEQLTLEFTSINPDEQMDSELQEDILDKVYKANNKTAGTIHDYIKEAKNQQIQTLRKILGAK